MLLGMSFVSVFYHFTVKSFYNGRGRLIPRGFFVSGQSAIASGVHKNCFKHVQILLVRVQSVSISSEITKVIQSSASKNVLPLLARQHADTVL